MGCEGGASGGGVRRISAPSPAKVAGAQNAAEPLPPVFVDIETTGIDPRRSKPYDITIIVPQPPRRPRVIQLMLPVTALDCDEGIPRDLYLRNLPGLPKPTDPAVAARIIAEATAGRVICGNNVRFDVNLLTDLLLDNGITPTWHYQLDEIESRAAQKLEAGPPPWKSDALSAALGVDPKKFARHTSVGDARWSMRQWEVLVGRDLGSNKLGTLGLSGPRGAHL